MLLVMYLLVIVGAVTFAVVGNARAKSLAQHTAERLLLAAPADFVDGAYVRVEGVIEATDLGLAPADATRYVALRLYVRVDGHWRVSTDLRPFVLRTEHGPIVVERQAEVALAMRPQFKGSLKRLPARYLPSEVRLRKLRSLHCEQTIVTPGMRVWVAGVVLLEPAPPTSRLGFRDTNQTVRLLSHAEHLLTIGEVPR